MRFNMLGDANHAGPVRLSDTYDKEVGGAQTGIAASQKALYDAYNSLNSSKASSSRVTTLEQKLSGNITCVGFVDKYYLTVGPCRGIYYYGVIFICTNMGDLQSYKLSGFSSTQTSTSGTFKTYKHEVSSDLYDFQVVFPSKWTHGFFIISGAIASQGWMLGNG